MLGHFCCCCWLPGYYRPDCRLKLKNPHLKAINIDYYHVNSCRNNVTSIYSNIIVKDVLLVTIGTQVKYTNIDEFKSDNNVMFNSNNNV